MSETLEFPVIDEALVSERTDVAVAASTAIDLTKIDLEDVALAQFGDWRAEVAATQKRLANIAWDVGTKSGLDDIKDVRHKQAKLPRAEANKIGDALVSKLAGVNKLVRAEQAAIVAAWDGVAAPLTKIIDDREQALAEEKAERERIEAERVAGHIAKINGIKAAADKCKGITSERIQTGIALVEAMTFGDDCQEFKARYEAAKAETLDAMRTHLADAQAREAAERQRLENERVARELAEQALQLAEQAAELKRQQAEALAARVAITHAVVFAFPEPEPEPDPVAPTPTQTPAEELAAAQASPEGAELSPAAQALNEEQGAARFAKAHPRIARAFAAPLPIEEIAAPIVSLINTAELCALVGLDLSVAEIEGFGLRTQVAPQGKRGTFWLADKADALTDALVSHLLKRKAERN